MTKNREDYIRLITELLSYEKSINEFSESDLMLMDIFCCGISKKCLDAIEYKKAATKGEGNGR